MGDEDIAGDCPLELEGLFCPLTQLSFLYYFSLAGDLNISPECVFLTESSLHSVFGSLLSSAFIADGSFDVVALDRFSEVVGTTSENRSEAITSPLTVIAFDCDRVWYI